MQALLEFLGMVPELTDAMQEDAPGSVLAGCERDCKHLAFKALTFLQQVAIHKVSFFCKLNTWLQCVEVNCHVWFQHVWGQNTKGANRSYSHFW